MSIWIQITAGRGPAECCFAVAHLALVIEQEAKENGTELRLLEQIAADEPYTYQSVVFSLNENEIPEWLKAWLGTIQWTNKSPFRPNHPRKNWFVGVQCLQQPEAKIWRNEDVRLDTFRSSGPGGQNVNKVESAVRATHMPTGLFAVAQEGRSQFENRHLAIERLQRKLQLEAERTKSNSRRELWTQHSNLERGNPVMTCSGPKFKRVSNKSGTERSALLQ